MPAQAAGWRKERDEEGNASDEEGGTREDGGCDHPEGSGAHSCDGEGLQVTEFSEQYAKMSAIERRQARKSLLAEVVRVLTEAYGRTWSKGKIAVKASKMVDESMRAGNAASN